MHRFNERRDLTGRPRPWWRRLSLWAAFCLTVLWPVASPAQGREATILVLGDSISAAYGIGREDGWVALLEQRLADSGHAGRVVNASISGETTGGGLARLPRALAEHHPAVVILELGGNDGLRGYPVDRLRGNLQQMIDLSRDAGAVPLLVGMQIPPNYGARYTRAFRETFASLAEANGIPLVPFLLEEVALKPGWMQADGIHPTREAQPAMLDAVWRVLEPLLRQGAPEKR